MVSNSPVPETINLARHRDHLQESKPVQLSLPDPDGQHVRYELNTYPRLALQSPQLSTGAGQHHDQEEDVNHKPTTVFDRLGALRGLLTISDDDFNAYMRSYDELFVDSPENTKADHDNGVPLKGYPQGSSDELQELYKIIHLLCTLGSVEKMYMPPEIDPEQSVLQNQILF